MHPIGNFDLDLMGIEIGLEKKMEFDWNYIQNQFFYH